MQLSVAQKHFIDFILSDFVTFSTDPALFREEVIALNAALTSIVPKEHPFFIVGECLRDPCSHFQGLERNDVPTTIGIVQIYILSFINQLVNEAAVKIQIDPVELSWNHSQLVTLCVDTENLQRPFESHTPITHIEGWEVTQESDAIYEYRIDIIPLDGEAVYAEDNFDLGFNDNENEQPLPDASSNNEDEPSLPDASSDSHENNSDSDSAPRANAGNILYFTSPMYLSNISITTHLTPDERELSNASAKVPYLDDNNAQNDLFRLKELSGMEAKKTSLGVAIKFLIKWDLLSLDLLKQHDLIDGEGLNFTPEETKLILHRFYFDLLREKKLGLTSLLKITAEQLDILCHPHIIHFLKNNALHFNQAKLLSRDMFRLLSTPFYFELISHLNIPLTDLLSLKENQTKLLIYPPIINLIRLGKLPYEIAIQLPLFAKPLFANPAYMTLFSRNNIDWSPMMKLNETHYKLLLNKSLVRVITSGQVSFEGLLNLPDLTLTILTDQPRLASWLYNGIISEEDIKIRMNRSLLTFYAGIYISRINHVRLGTPRTIDNNIDTIENILAEIHPFSTEAKLLEQILFDKIIDGITNLIIEDIRTRAASLPAAFHPLLEIIHQHRTLASSQDYACLLIDLLEKATKMTDIKTDSITLYRPAKRLKSLTNHEDEGLRNFCIQLKALLPIKDSLTQTFSRTWGLI